MSRQKKTGAVGRSSVPHLDVNEHEREKEQIRKQYKDFMEGKDKELNTMRKRLNIQDNYIRKIHENGNQKLKQMEKEYKKKLAELTEEVEILKENGNEQKRRNDQLKDKLKSMSIEVNEVGNLELPSILRQKNRFALKEILTHLDPMSFSRLIRSSKYFHRLADSGILSYELSLDCDSPKGKGVPYFILNGKEMSVTGTMNMANSNWIRTKLRRLLSWPATAPFYFPRNAVTNSKLMELLDLAKIKMIDEVDMRLYQEDLDFDFLKKYKIRKLSACSVSCSLDQIAQELPLIEDLSVRFRRYLPRKQDPSEFLQNYAAARIEISNAVASSTIIPSLIRLWLTGEKIISKYQFEADYNASSHFHPLNIHEMPWLRNIEFVSKRTYLTRMSAMELISLAQYKVSVLLHDGWGNWLVMRGDGVALKGICSEDDENGPWYITIEEVV